MSKFQRENRYMVVKLKHLSESQEHALDTILSEHQIDTHTVECVVVEADWPIYEETWENVRRLAEGRASIRDELARAEAERDAFGAQLDRPRIKMLGDLIRAGLEPDNIPASLARLKAQWQAEVLYELMALIGAGASADEVSDWLVSESTRLHGQAGGDA